jgi:hypothetical protein
MDVAETGNGTRLVVMFEEMNVPMDLPLDLRQCIKQCMRFDPVHEPFTDGPVGFRKKFRGDLSGEPFL